LPAYAARAASGHIDSDARERGPLGLVERPRAPVHAVARDDDRLGLGRELAVRGPDLLAKRQARGPDPAQPAGDDDLAVLETELAPEVDRDAGEDESSVPMPEE
jgi:hypothetical protein